MPAAVDKTKANKAALAKAAKKERQAAMGRIKAANKLDDMQSIYDRLCPELFPYTVKCQMASDLEDAASSVASIEWCLDLIEANMVDAYRRSSLGWHRDEKRLELDDHRARYLVMYDSEGAPMAFMHYRFELEDGVDVIYLYEIQVQNGHRNKGIGRHMVTYLQDLGTELGLGKVLLTCFKHNPDAMRFYKERFDFAEDDSSPNVCDPYNPVDYEILCLKLR
eukprot:Clim_evm27s153 gene=Clim_evmTU27s153